MNQLTINEYIRANTVRIVEDAVLSGVVPFGQAMARARELGLDLVMIADGTPPVCRILNADRFRYEKKRAARDQMRKQRELSVETKEIQLRPVTDDNDIAIKARRANAFLAEGDKVRVVVRFKGRERSHRENGKMILLDFLSKLDDHRVERPMAEFGEMVVLLAPMISKADLRKKAPLAA